MAVGQRWPRIHERDGWRKQLCAQTNALLLAQACAKGEHGAVLRKVLTHKKVLTLQACADPLKGGKMEQWEGGIRVNSWASGGFLPAKVRGTKYEGLACGWDWCTLPPLFPSREGALRLRKACTQPAEDLGGFVRRRHLLGARWDRPDGLEGCGSRPAAR